MFISILRYVKILKSRVKQINAISAQKITNIVDVESKNSDALKRFEKTLKNMKDAEKLGKPIKFDLAYSNFSFELWLLLHKIDCNQSLSCIDNYGYSTFSVGK